jgi:hypothetical protein
VVRQPIPGSQFVSNVLVKGGALQVSTLFGVDHLFDDFSRSNHPANA